MYPEIPRRFPHAKPIETEILKKWLEQAPLGTEYEFDVRLYPEIRPLRPTDDPEMYYAWMMLRAKRIDVVAHTRDAIWLLEVKDRLRPSAIGQLLVYRNLYERQFRPLLPIRLGVICGDTDPMVEPACADLGIKIFNMGIPSALKRLLG